MDEHCQSRILDPPEGGCVSVGEWFDDQFHAGAAAQWCVAREEFSHDGHGRSAEQDPGPGLAGVAAGIQGALQVLRTRMNPAKKRVGTGKDASMRPPRPANSPSVRFLTGCPLRG